MSKLNDNFQKFLRTIHRWPTATIEKSTLIQILNDLCEDNPELQNIYDNSLVSAVGHDDGTQSCVDTISEKPAVQHRNQPISQVVLVKGGDLTVRKGSTILSSLLKSGWKTSVYGELTYSWQSDVKHAHFTVYQDRKKHKAICTFAIHNSCSFLRDSKREFQFKHASGIERFVTESGTADAWIDSFRKATTTQDCDIAELYENIDDLLSRLTMASSVDIVSSATAGSSILAENIYVCLYDHRDVANGPYELTFHRGDLLYIVNTDDANFYIGRQLTFPLDGPPSNPAGLVFKEYITPAYERIA